MKVISIRQAPHNWRELSEYVYIGRPSIYGNPFVVGKTCNRCGEIHSTGGSTLRCYREYMEERMSYDKSFADAIETLRGKILVCFCKPAPCHGDVILNHLNSTDEMICEWPNGTWCFRYDLWQMTHLSDDFIVKAYDKGDEP